MTAEVVAAPTGRRIPSIHPESPEWLLTMSASKIPAVLGLSTWESPYSLWHYMAGLLPRAEAKPHQQRGHYLEPAIAAWFADEHPDWLVRPASSWCHPDNERFTAAPDRELLLPGGEIRGLELKSDAQGDGEWGEPGTDQIPAGYAAQVQWQMACAGYSVTHVAVLSAYLEFREYVVHAEPSDAELLVRAATDFLDSLPTGPKAKRPDLDSHDATYDVVRRMHPDIEDREEEVSAEIATRYPAAVLAAKAAERELVGAKAQLLDEMGAAKKAAHLGTPIARRQPARGGAVALYSLATKDPR